jgi:hypothetical protein
MCPACLATISMMVAGVISSGGVAALTAKALQRRGAPRGAAESNAGSEEKMESSTVKEKQQ